jgi:hypothetical protein
MAEVKPLSTPVSTTTALDVNEDSKPMDKEYRRMISYLMYLTAMKPDIQFAVCLCTRF